MAKCAAHLDSISSSGSTVVVVVSLELMGGKLNWTGFFGNFGKALESIGTYFHGFS